MSTKLSKLALGCAVALGFFTLAQAQDVKIDPSLIDIKDKPEFLASIGIKEVPKAEKLPKAENLKKTEEAFNEKNAQHFMSVHAEKGMSCVTCHNQQTNSGTNWMIKATKPVMKQTCQDCHTVQADVVSRTDTHDKIDCIACHMPNIPAVAAYEGDQAKAAGKAIRRSHAYKINVDPAASSVVEQEITVDGKQVKGFALAKDEDGHAFIDLMWSCARNAPADYTVFEGKGCHSQYRSTLDEGLIYQDQKEIYGETMKWQKPVKEGYKEVVGGIARINKLLEVTRLSREDQTEVRLLLDKADDIAALIRKDGSYGVHAHNYLKDRVETAKAFLYKAQSIIDGAGYGKVASK